MQHELDAMDSLGVVALAFTLWWQRGSNKAPAVVMVVTNRYQVKVNNEGLGRG